MKKCKLCGENKMFDNFYLCRGNYSSRCKKCFSEYQKNNPNRKENLRKYENKSRKKLNEKNRESYNKNIEESRRYNREKRKRLRASNLEKYRNYEKIKNKERYSKLKANPKFKIERLIRSRILKAIKSEYKKTKSFDLLGCSISELKLYIESKFENGMTWENHGVFGWHIDHIIPCASFDLTDIEQQKKCFHYSNLQPLWWYDNLKKSDKVG
jgi:hypothetical protein